MRACFYALAALALWTPALVAQPGGQAPDPDQPYGGQIADPVTYQVDLQFVITPPYHAKVLKVWVPLPPSDAVQEVSGRRLSSFPQKVTPKIGREPLYGNEFAYFEFDHPEGAQIVRHQFRLSLRPGRPQVSLPEHLAIVNAIVNRDPAAAEAAARAHLGSVIDALRAAETDPL